MIAEHAFGELLEACLAIDLAYLALDRFRYREAIRRILDSATSHLEGMPAKYRTDKAWTDMGNIRSAGGPDSNSPFLHFVYRYVFDRLVDRGVITAAASVAFFVLVARAFFAPVEPPYSPFWLQLTIFVFLVSTTLCAAALIKIGRMCVHKVAAEIIENVGHLARQYKDENAPAAEAMLDLVGDLELQGRT